MAIALPRGARLGHHGIALVSELRRCVAPLDDDGERLCGADATEERTVEDLVMPLCAEHARELDEERAADAAELASIAAAARAAGFTGHLPEGDLSEWCVELKAAGLEQLADRVRETEAYRNS